MEECAVLILPELNRGIPRRERAARGCHCYRMMVRKKTTNTTTTTKKKMMTKEKRRKQMMKKWC
jgi:hypothetical protein